MDTGRDEMTAKQKIAKELYQAINTLGGSGQLLSIVGSYGDTLEDDDVLAMLRQWNDQHRTPVAPR
jgi:hypothetical protein